MVLGIIKEHQNLEKSEILDIILSKSQDSLSAPTQLAYANKLLSELESQRQSLVEYENKIKQLKTPIEDIERYMEIEGLFKTGMLSAKSQRKLKSERYKLCEKNLHLEREVSIMQTVHKQRNNIRQLEEEHSAALSYLQKEVSSCISLLAEFNCLLASSHLKLTSTGIVASNVYETHPLVFANYITSTIVRSLTNETFDATSLASTLSMFCDSSIKPDDSIDNALTTCQDATRQTKTLTDQLEYAYQREQQVLGGYYITQEHLVSSRLYPHVVNWCKAQTSAECIEVLQDVYNTTGISSGDFVKSLLKIIKLSKELLSSAQEMGDLYVRLEKLCSDIPELLMKYIVTNQSLYI